jgi:6-pyruvoyltetrahydropterin/6-carboxytetrahydropterin synthase
MRVTLTRIYHFAGSHRLHSPKLSEAENLTLFRECNNQGGHGHNFYLHVTVTGPIDRRTGMIVNLGDLDPAIQEHVLRKVDHRFYSAEYLQLSEAPDHPEPWIATSENIVRVIYPWAQAAMPPGVELVRLQLDETASNRFEYAGEQPLLQRSEPLECAP